MCPPLLKTCSWVIAQFNGLWRQGLTSFALRCVLTQDVYRRLRNHRRVSLRFRTVLSFRSIRGFISFGKRIFFLTVLLRRKSWCQEISTYKLAKKLLKVILLPRWREFKTCVKYSYTVITVQAQVSQRTDNSSVMDKSLSSYSNYWSFLKALEI